MFVIFPFLFDDKHCLCNIGFVFKFSCSHVKFLGYSLIVSSHMVFMPVFKYLIQFPTLGVFTLMNACLVNLPVHLISSFCACLACLGSLGLLCTDFLPEIDYFQELIFLVHLSLQQCFPPVCSLVYIDVIEGGFLGSFQSVHINKTRRSFAIAVDVTYQVGVTEHCFKSEFYKQFLLMIWLEYSLQVTEVIKL